MLFVHNLTRINDGLCHLRLTLGHSPTGQALDIAYEAVTVKVVIYSCDTLASTTICNHQPTTQNIMLSPDSRFTLLLFYTGLNRVWILDLV